MTTKTALAAAAVLALAAGARAGAADTGDLDARVAHAQGFASSKLLPKVLNTGVAFHWIAGRDRFWFRKSLDATHQAYVLVDAATGAQSALFDNPAMAGALKAAGAKDGSVEGIRAATVADDGRAIVVSLRRPGAPCRWPSGESCVTDVDRYGCDLPVTACKPLPAAPGADLALSPDRKRAVFLRADNLWIRDLATGAERQLTTDGVAHFGYGDLNLPRDNQQVPQRRAGLPDALNGVAWSPDGRYILALRHDLRPIPDRLQVVEYTPPEGGMPIVHTQRKALPLDAHYPDAALTVIDTQAGTAKRSDIDSQLFADYAVISFQASLSWTNGDTHAWVLGIKRPDREERLVDVDLATGKARDVIVETSDAPLIQNQAGYNKPNMRVLSSGKEALWYSERDGWGHLYLYDAVTGKAKRQVTHGPWLVADLLRVDEARRLIYFTAVGKEPGAEPYYRKLYVVGLDGGEPRLLTPEEADHDFGNAADGPARGASLSPNGHYVIDSYSTVTEPDRTVLRRIDGQKIADVIRADVSALTAMGWRPPERFVAKAADGKTDLHGVMFKPLAFDPTKKYPVIDINYPGGQDKFGPTDFRDDFLGSTSLNAQAFAELGAVVVGFDGRGSGYRSAAFHNAFNNNADDPRGMVDHKAAIQNLGAQHAYLDLTRVGLTGHSYGGYGALRGMLMFPDFFKVGVAGEGPGNFLNLPVEVATERLFGVPDTPQGLEFYRRVSNESLADRLDGKLLLIFGGADENVQFQNGMQLALALERANKVFDTLVLPDSPHYGGREPYGLMRSLRYFAENLGGPR